MFLFDGRELVRIVGTDVAENVHCIGDAAMCRCPVDGKFRKVTVKY